MAEGLLWRLRRWEGDGHPHGLLHREAAAAIEHQQEVIERLRESLEGLLVAVEASATVKRGDFYHARKVARDTLASLKERE